MPSTFTPSNAVDLSKERDWPASLGMLDWDSTNIVFTKRSLIEFLKYTGTTVDTNFANISKLPKYAKFGKITENAQNDVGSEQTQQPSGSSTVLSPSGEPFKPTRRVKDPPGGAHSNIFGSADDDDALAGAPPRPAEEYVPTPARQAPPPPDEETSGIQFSCNVKPTRRVREYPGGKDSLASFWGNDEEHAEEFKPTRRVREGPGGRDQINGLF